MKTSQVQTDPLNPASGFTDATLVTWIEAGNLDQYKFQTHTV